MLEKIKQKIKAIPSGVSLMNVPAFRIENIFLDILEYISKKEPSSDFNNGLLIVDDVSKLDPNAELGSIACVVEQGSIKESLISELPQSDSSIINPNTSFIDATSCPKVSELSIIVPEKAIPVSMELTEFEMLYFCSEGVDLMNGTTGVILGILPQIVNNEIVALAGMYRNITNEEMKQWVFFTIQNGVVSVDQAAINEFNTYMQDLHYIGAIEYVMSGLSLTTEQLAIYDNVIKVVDGIPSKSYIYLKNDKWEKLYAKDFENITSNVASNIGKIETKADKMPIESYSSYKGLKPNVYTTYINQYTGNDVTIRLADITDPSIYNEYIIEVKCVGTPSSVKFVDSNNVEIPIKYANDMSPVFSGGYTYIISIVNNFGVFSSFIN